jgi:hypothetical protein
VRAFLQPLRVLMLMLRRLPLSLLTIPIVVASAVTGCKKKEPAAQASVESSELVLRAALSERLGASSFAVVGEVARGDRRAIIVWPGLAEGQPAAPAAHVFTTSDGEWKPVGDPIYLRTQGSEALAEALGSGEQRVARDCGLPEDELAAHLQMHGKAFAEALDAGDSKAAISAYEQLARAFAWEHVASSTLLLDLLLTPAPKSWYCGEKGCTVESSWESRRRLQTFGHAECGGGKVVGDVLATQP